MSIWTVFFCNLDDRVDQQFYCVSSARWAHHLLLVSAVISLIMHFVLDIRTA
jgi:hypothetical protein